MLRLSLLSIMGLLLVCPPSALAQETCDVFTSQSETQAALNDDNADGLGGRLGGSRAQFEAMYGEPISDDFFSEYEIAGCGDVLVTYFEDEVLIDISLFSPREGEEFDAREPDEADWTVQEAEAIVARFLPTDAHEIGTLVDDDFLLMVEGFSSTLESIVPVAAYDYGDNTPTYGGYSYAFHLTTDRQVSWITLQLNIEDDF